MDVSSRGSRERLNDGQTREAVTRDYMPDRSEVGPVAKQPTDAGYSDGECGREVDDFWVHGNVPSGFVPGTQLRGAAAGPPNSRRTLTVCYAGGRYS